MYRLLLKDGAKSEYRELERSSPILYREASNILFDLLDNPHPADALAMWGEHDGLYRIRFNNHRIVYTVNDTEEIITILAIRPRTKNTYTNFF